jgi:hypothetical protein
MLLGDRLTMQDMLNLLRDQNLAKVLVERAEALSGGQTAVTDFFRKEALGDTKDKFFQFAPRPAIAAGGHHRERDAPEGPPRQVRRRP